MEEAFGENGNFMMQMGMQYGQRLVKEGEKGFVKYLPVGELRRYFRVSNEYVRAKLGILAFPFTRDFSRQSFSLDDSATIAGGTAGSPTGAAGGALLSPMEDNNVPDLYIPLMALITYVTLGGFAKGLKNEALSPQDLATALTTAIILHICEVIAIKLVRYVVGLPPMFSTLDLIALCGYKYVGVCVVLFLKELALAGWPAWFVTAYWAAAAAFFMYKSVRELASREGRAPKRAVFVAYGAAAFQVPMLFFYAKA